MFSQVSKANPDRVFMKWFGDWELLERDESQLKHLRLSGRLRRDTDPHGTRAYKLRDNLPLVISLAKARPDAADSRNKRGARSQGPRCNGCGCRINASGL